MVWKKVNGEWIALTSTTELSYVDTDVEAGQEYTYTARSYIKNGQEVTWSSFKSDGYKVICCNNAG